ncbi:MAG: glutathione S-transferase family protein [Halioglobus sp.]
MKLYSLPHSPYATRVRTLIRKGELDIEICHPPEALRTPEFVQHFPMGKIPVLELDDASQLPDSWVIMEYLDAVACAGAYTPGQAKERAHMQILARYADTYLSPGGLFPLFKLVGQTDKGADTNEALAALNAELARLERILATQPSFQQRDIHLGDMALVPHLDFVLLLGPMFGEPEPLSAYPLVKQWYDWAVQDSAVAESSKEMCDAVAKLFGG